MVYFCTNGEMLKRVKNVKSVWLFSSNKVWKICDLREKLLWKYFPFPQYALGKKELGFVNNMEIQKNNVNSFIRAVLLDSIEKISIIKCLKFCQKQKNRNLLNVLPFEVFPPYHI